MAGRSELKLFIVYAVYSLTSSERLSHCHLGYDFEQKEYCRAIHQPTEMNYPLRPWDICSSSRDSSGLWQRGIRQAEGVCFTISTIPARSAFMRSQFLEVYYSEISSSSCYRKDKPVNNISNSNSNFWMDGRKREHNLEIRIWIGDDWLELWKYHPRKDFFLFWNVGRTNFH